MEKLESEMIQIKLEENYSIVITRHGFSFHGPGNGAEFLGIEI